MHTSQSLWSGALLAAIGLCSACAPVKSPEAKVYSMGERVPAGSLTYNVFEDQWKTQLGEGQQARIPKDRFFLVRLSVVNGGSTEAMVPLVSLVDDAGQTYPELSNGDAVPSWTGYLRRIRPAETLEGNIVFDVPPKHYRPRVSDENSQKSRDIDIPLAFTSETPDMPTPAAPTQQ